MRTVDREVQLELKRERVANPQKYRKRQEHPFATYDEAKEYFDQLTATEPDGCRVRIRRRRACFAVVVYEPILS